MSGTVVPRTYPYRPSGGFTPDEIWGGSSGPARDDIPDGATQETKDRLKNVGFSALDSLLKWFQYKVEPAKPGEAQRAPGEVTNAGMGPETPIRIVGKAAPPPETQSKVGLYIVAGMGAFLILALVLESRAAR